MDTTKFIELCVDIIKDWYKETTEITDNFEIKDEDIYVVWCVKALQNSKGLFSTKNIDGMYFEMTYNGDKKEIYFDAYKKWQNKAIKVDEYGKGKTKIYG